MPRLYAYRESHGMLWSETTASVYGGESMRKYDHGPGIHG